MRSIVCLAVVACGHHGPPATPPPSADGERLLRGFAAAIAASDQNAMAQLFADDAVIVGFPNCKGKPCVGLADFRERYIARMLPAHPFAVHVIRTERDRVWASWLAEFPDGERTDQDRGTLIVTTAAGRISRLVFFYDLGDPGTILQRALGEKVFALQDPDRARNTQARVLLSPLDEHGRKGTTHTAIAVYLGAPEDANLPSATASVHAGRCAQLGPVLFPLPGFVDARTDALLPIAMDALVVQRFSVAIRATDGKLLACGELPYHVHCEE